MNNITSIFISAEKYVYSSDNYFKYILPNGVKQAIKRPFVNKTPKETAWLEK